MPRWQGTGAGGQGDRYQRFSQDTAGVGGKLRMSRSGSCHRAGDCVEAFVHHDHSREGEPGDFTGPGALGRIVKQAIGLVL